MEERNEFTLEEVRNGNGEDGKPTYIVHRDRVIDVSNSKLWKGGLHMRRHHAGADLTTEIQAAPHGLEVLDRYPQVGVLNAPVNASTRPIPAGLAAILA